MNKESIVKALKSVAFYAMTITIIGIGGVNVVNGVALAYDRYRENLMTIANEDNT